MKRSHVIFEKKKKKMEYINEVRKLMLTQNKASKSERKGKIGTQSLGF